MYLGIRHEWLFLHHEVMKYDFFHNTLLIHHIVHLSFSNEINNIKNVNKSTISHSIFPTVYGVPFFHNHHILVDKVGTGLVITILICSIAHM